MRSRLRLLYSPSLPSARAIRDMLGDRILKRTERAIANKKGSDADLAEWDDPEFLEADHSNATLATSLLANGNHMVAIDIDRECMLVPSGTPGHFHLYVNVEMTRAQYFSMLNAMVIAGVIEAGFYAHAVRRGMTMVRYPGVTKQNEAARIRETSGVADDRYFDDETF